MNDILYFIDKIMISLNKKDRRKISEFLLGPFPAHKIYTFNRTAFNRTANKPPTLTSSDIVGQESPGLA